MPIKEWKYYNHALIPTCAPHEVPAITPDNHKNFWKMADGFPILARWTTDFDTNEKTNWWYIIREAPYSLEALTSKSSRKNIRRAIEKCDVYRIDPRGHIEELFRCYREAYARYTDADNQKGHDEFVSDCIQEANTGIEYWAGFNKENNLLIGYTTVAVHTDYVEILVAKFWPEYMSIGVSHALYHTVLDYYLNFMGKRYVSSGSRSVNHITQTQEYKERLFGYRKAYCKLRICYNPKIKVIISMLYGLRKILKRMDRISIIHRINAVIKMEEIARSSVKPESDTREG